MPDENSPSSPLRIARRHTRAGVHPYDEVEWETRTARVGMPGEAPKFEQHGVEMPAFWSQNATDIVVQKYFAYSQDDPRRETSVRQLIDRVVHTIGAAGMQTQPEAERPYFANDEERETFEAELTHILLHQKAAFNSPVWFNVGKEGARQQCSACFILAIEDSLEAISTWQAEETLIFKRGSGSGVNLSELRGSNEQLALGGTSSGPVTFMRAADANAGTIQSGGTCLAPWQRVYTAQGPVAVSELDGQEFVAISYDPPAGRFKAKTARAWKSEIKQVVEIVTDKGRFYLSDDHPVRLTTGEYRKAGDLQENNSLFSGSIEGSSGYRSIYLRNGKKGREKLSRLVAADVMGLDVDGMSVHHLSGDKLDDRPENLASVTQSDHASAHNRQLVEHGEHVFQTQQFSHAAGRANGMHAEGRFWSSDLADGYRQAKSTELLERGDAREMQREAAEQKMLNLAFELLNAGWPIDTFEQYMTARLAVRGDLGCSRAALLEKIEGRFGSYDGFRQAVAERNHRVLSVSLIGFHPTYDVEVDCPTDDDKSPITGHNFLIWDGENNFGSGIVVSNTRRAAKMVVLNIDHPDVDDFIWCKAREEDRIRALQAAGFEIGIGTDTGEKNLAEATAYQNANNSVRVTQEFLDAVENDSDWDLKSRLTGETTRTVPARKLMGDIAEAAWRCADPGVQYDTTINDWHTTPSLGPITASNPCCFVGETLVRTEEGRLPISELEERAANKLPLPRVYSFDCERNLPVLRQIQNAWVAGEVKKLVEIRTESGHSFRCTPEHRFLLHSGEYSEAAQLLKGMRLRGIGQAQASSDDPQPQQFERWGEEHRAPVIEIVSDVRSFLAEQVPVYDIEVEGTNNFAIATEGIEATPIVHNSEYMSNDNTSCNLASLNLMQFLRPDGGFDVEDFQHCARVLFTAQDITISFGDFPTEKIAENSRNLRQIGIGFANLGALLMAMGHAYDSHEGRNIAGAVTALLTGESYLQSTYLAEAVGAFHHYEENSKPMQRVLRKHREASKDLYGSCSEIIKAAQKSWNETVKRCAGHGVRNAQSSVLAPTGCLVADSLVSTSRGLVRLGTLGDPDGPQWQPLDIEVATDEGPRQATQFYVNGQEQVVSVETKRGYRIQGTPTHRIKVVDAAGDWVWRRMAELQSGDQVPLALGELVGEPNKVVLPLLRDLDWNADVCARAPRAMNAELAELVGYFMGAGSLHKESLQLYVADGEDNVVQHLAQLACDLFGLQPQLRVCQGYTEVVIHSVPLTIWWDACGFAKDLPRTGHSDQGSIPRLPNAVLYSNDHAVYEAFVRGLSAIDRTVNHDYALFGTTSESFSRDMQTLLLSLGLVTARETEGSQAGQSDRYVLRLLNVSAAMHFAEEIGFISARKTDTFFQGEQRQAEQGDQLSASQKLVDKLAFHNNAHKETMFTSFAEQGNISQHSATAVLERKSDPDLDHLIDYFYDEIETTELLEDQPTFDLSVPDNVTYVANGFVSHNTIAFMMDCDTTGVEPDFSLIKGKTMAGGGRMLIPNRTIVPALRNLGYSANQAEDVLAHIMEDIDKGGGFSGPRGLVVDAPHLRPEHYSVFDTAIGERAISWRGHLRMMGACQPFLSGAISKTVNLPESATAEEIEEIYLEGGCLGLKAVAVYRDNCKAFQPLSDAKSKTRDADVQQAVEERKTSLLGDGLLRGERRKVSRKAPINGVGFDLGMTSGYITVREFEDGKPGAIFIDVGQAGGTLAGFIKALSVSMSLGFQYGMSLDILVSKLAGMQFEPYGFTDDPDIQQAKSLVDYIVKWLALEYLDPDVHPELGIGAARAQAVADSSADEIAPKVEVHAATRPAQHHGERKDSLKLVSEGKLCDSCGSQMQRTGACWTCPACGNNNGGCG